MCCACVLTDCPACAVSVYRKPRASRQNEFSDGLQASAPGMCCGHSVVCGWQSLTQADGTSAATCVCAIPLRSGGIRFQTAFGKRIEEGFLVRRFPKKGVFSICRRAARLFWRRRWRGRGASVCARCRGRRRAAGCSTGTGRRQTGCRRLRGCCGNARRSGCRC